MSVALHKKLTVMLVLLLVIFGATIAYCNSALMAQASKLSALQQTNNELESQNAQLEQRLSSLDQSARNASVLGFNAVAIYDSANQSVVTVQGSKTVTVLTLFGPQQSVDSIVGSGFVVDYANSDYVLTNFHVVDGAVNITVTFWNGDAYPAKVIGNDPLSDLAVLSLNAPTRDLHSLDISSSSSLRVGMPVVAIGNPFGLSGSVTFGIISQLGRTVQYESASTTFTVSDIIQFSAPLNPGNSGGPLLDTYGFVVGITSAAVSGGQGVGFAIPSDTILRELPYLISTGKYDQHPYVGIQAVDMNYQLALASGTNVSYGVLVEATQSGGPADKAGLRAGTQQVSIAGQQYTVGGDIIVSVNGVRIVNYDSFSTYLERNTIPGQVIQVGIIRAGKPLTLSIVVGSAPSQ
jgi:S1-C subfamily serine protease